MADTDEKLDPALQLSFMWSAIEEIPDDHIKQFFDQIEGHHSWFNALPPELKPAISRLFIEDVISFGNERKLLVNCSDTFEYAFADCEVLPLDQVATLDSLRNGYGYAGVAAWVAHRRKPQEPDIVPINCPCHGANPEFMKRYTAALEELEEAR